MFAGVIHLNKRGICVLGCLLFILVIYLNRNYSSWHVEVKKINLQKLLKVVIKATENGGKEVVRVKDHITIESKGLTKEGLIDSVTTADFLSHCSMIRTLMFFYPSIKVISEEAKTKCTVNHSINYSLNESIGETLSDEYVDEKDVTIWVDPLDATQEYTEKLYNYVTTMACVVVKGEAVIGVIHKPFNSTTSWAWVHRAASKDLIMEKTEKNEETLRIIVSRSHSGEIKEVLQNKFKNKFRLISAAGAGFKALEVATGKSDAYLHITAIKKWDICAGNAIINAMNGRMTTKFNKIIDYSSDEEVKNEDGLIATMKNHELFLGVL